ncbi:MAG: CgeB family protein [Pyrinomonadaceae bacterium]
MMTFSHAPLRILAVADVWQGSDAYAFVRAFRRMGHSVSVVPPENYVPSAWKRTSLRGLRRIFEPTLVSEYTEALISEARQLRPHLFFVFKGRYVTAEAIETIRKAGAVAINFYPDVSFMVHGRYIPAALPQYDWIFTTKSFGPADMERLLAVHHSSVLPPSYDPETHAPVALDEDDAARYQCDVSFIGTWSPKKQQYLEQLQHERPEVRLRIWGSQWENARGSLGLHIEGRHVLGVEYAKALIGSKINLAILSEARTGASSGDQITARTFQIPATGAFMLHERTEEFADYFREDVECACFHTVDDLVAKIAYFLGHPKEREQIAMAGYRRCLESGYAVDDRAAIVLNKLAEFRGTRGEPVGSGI